MQASATRYIHRLYIFIRFEWEWLKISYIAMKNASNVDMDTLRKIISKINRSYVRTTSVE